MKYTYSLFLLLSLLAFGACGKKTVEIPKDNNGNQSPGRTANEDEDEGEGDAPLSYEINQKGSVGAFITPPIRSGSDAVLEARYIVGPTGGRGTNGTDVSVTVTLMVSSEDGVYTDVTSKTPLFDDGNNGRGNDCPTKGCEFGRPSDGPSRILKFSSYITAGTKVKLKVENFRYDWHCRMYDPTDPLYWNLGAFRNEDGSCNPSDVAPAHNIEGRLVVRIDSTNPVLFKSKNP